VKKEATELEVEQVSTGLGVQQKTTEPEVQQVTTGPGELTKPRAMKESGSGAARESGQWADRTPQ
jgi:hypothetical protein